MGVQEYRAKLDRLYQEKKTELMRAEKRTLKAVHVSEAEKLEMAYLKGQMTAFLAAIGECFALIENQPFKGFEK